MKSHVHPQATALADAILFVGLVIGANRDVSLDHLVGSREQCGRDGKTEYSCCLHINRQLKLRGLDDWKVCGLGALEDITRIDAHLTPCIAKARSITYQAPSFDVLTPGTHRRH